MAKPRKRSKHLVVQPNPFIDEDIPASISPTQHAATGSNANGEQYNNEKYRSSAEPQSYQPPGYKKTIIFEDARNGKNVSFYAFTDSVNESFQVNYQQIEKLGSPEPIFHYSGTSKTINLSFKAMEDDYIPVDGETGTDKGPSLQERIDILKTMVYPDVDTYGNPTHPPLTYLTYGQLAEEYASEAAANNDRALPRKRNKVFGYITSLTVDYTNELGYTKDFKSRQVNISIGFQQINTGIVGRIEKPKP